jgi:uncharacterized protein (TIGR03437 family)
LVFSSLLPRAIAASEAYFTFDVPPAPDTFVIRLLDPALIQHARDILSGAAPNQRMMGKIVKAPAFYSSPWTFHLDPHSIRFFDFAIEVCDASIVYVQEHLEEAGGSFLPGNAWCPWGSRLKSEIPAPPGAATAITAVSAASYSEVALAPDSLGTIFGAALADRTEIASETPWPQSLAGISITVTPAATGAAQQARLAFASPTQVNFVVPPGISDGVATITLHRAGVATRQTFARIEHVAPALFHIGPDFEGYAAAIVVRVSADGAQTRESLVSVDAAGKLQPEPVRPGSKSERLFLELYGTGLRNSAADSVSVLVDEQQTTVLFVGPHSIIPGLDQINVELPSDLSITGDARVQLTVNDDLRMLAANAVRLFFADGAGAGR